MEFLEIHIEIFFSATLECYISKVRIKVWDHFRKKKSNKTKQKKQNKKNKTKQNNKKIKMYVNPNVVCHVFFSSFKLFKIVCFKSFATKTMMSWGIF